MINSMPKKATGNLGASHVNDVKPTFPRPRQLNGWAISGIITGTAFLMLSPFLMFAAIGWLFPGQSGETPTGPALERMADNAVATSNPEVCDYVEWVAREIPDQERKTEAYVWSCLIVDSSLKLGQYKVESPRPIIGIDRAEFLTYTEWNEQVGGDAERLLRTGYIGELQQQPHVGDALARDQEYLAK